MLCHCIISPIADHPPGRIFASFNHSSENFRVNASCSWTPSHHSVRAVKTPLVIDQKILSISREDMLGGFLILEYTLNKRHLKYVPNFRAIARLRVQAPL